MVFVSSIVFVNYVSIMRIPMSSFFCAFIDVLKYIRGKLRFSALNIANDAMFYSTKQDIDSIDYRKFADTLGIT